MKLGTVSHSSSKILDNLKMALPAIVKRIKGEWDNIQSLHIKTNSSVSLPLYSCDLSAAEGGRWDGLVAELASEGEESEVEESEEESAEGSDEEAIPVKKSAAKPTAKASKKHDATPMDIDDEPSPSSKEHAKGKGKKRAAEDVTANTPQKKAKADPTPDPATKAQPDKVRSVTSTRSAPKLTDMFFTVALHSTCRSRAPPTQHRWFLPHPALPKPKRADPP